MHTFRFSMGLLVLFTCALNFSYAAPTMDPSHLCGAKYTRDKFNSFHITAAQAKNPKKLRCMVQKILKDYPQMGIYFHQPLKGKQWVDPLKTLHFNIDTALNNTQEILWLLRDGREIPEFSRNKPTASVFIYCPSTKRFLCVKDKFLGWIIPGGCVDAGEHIHEAAAREAMEEAKVTLDPSKLEFMGVMTSVRDNPMFGKMNTHTHIFLAIVDKECGASDGKETLDVRWLSLETLEDGKAYEGTNFHPLVPQFLKAMKENTVGKYIPANPTMQIVTTRTFKDLGID